jgi:NADH dehydrogenase [ubiquinone] 1 alpha subcomplex assembly factor 6
MSHTLSHLSTLLTTVSLLRNLPVLVSSKRQINIPSDICAKHGIVEEQVLRKGAEANGLRDGLWEIGTRGMDELITARRDLKGTAGKVEPSSVMPLFLSAVSMCELVPG